MPSTPSVMSSTLSMLACWSVACFTCAAVGVGCYLGNGGDKETAALIMTPFGTLLTGFGMSYLTARKPDNKEG